MPKSLSTSVRLTPEGQRHMRLLLEQTRLSQSELINFALEYLFLDIIGGRASREKFFNRFANVSETPAKEKR